MVCMVSRAIWGLALGHDHSRCVLLWMVAFYHFYQFIRTLLSCYLLLIISSTSVVCFEYARGEPFKYDLPVIFAVTR